MNSFHKKLTGFQVKTTIAAGFTQSVREPIDNIYYADHLHTNIYFQWKNRTNFCSNYFIYRATAALQVKVFSGTYQYIGSRNLSTKNLKILI